MDISQAPKKAVPQLVIGWFYWAFRDARQDHAQRNSGGGRGMTISLQYQQPSVRGAVRAGAARACAVPSMRGAGRRGRQCEHGDKEARGAKCERSASMHAMQIQLGKLCMQAMKWGERRQLRQLHVA
eukprot:6212362-Pleurochrysis_carterae.AAC.6